MQEEIKLSKMGAKGNERGAKWGSKCLQKVISPCWFYAVFIVVVWAVRLRAPRKAVRVGSDWGYLDGESADNLASDAPCDCSLQDCPCMFY